jgi:hypothetical protein
LRIDLVQPHEEDSKETIRALLMLCEQEDLSELRNWDHTQSVRIMNNMEVLKQRASVTNIRIEYAEVRYIHDVLCPRWANLNDEDKIQFQNKFGKFMTYYTHLNYMQYRRDLQLWSFINHFPGLLNYNVDSKDFKGKRGAYLFKYLTEVPKGKQYGTYLEKA